MIKASFLNISLSTTAVLGTTGGAIYYSKKSVVNNQPVTHMAGVGNEYQSSGDGNMVNDLTKLLSIDLSSVSSIAKQINGLGGLGKLMDSGLSQFDTGQLDDELSDVEEENDGDQDAGDEEDEDNQEFTDETVVNTEVDKSKETNPALQDADKGKEDKAQPSGEEKQVADPTATNTDSTQKNENEEGDKNKEIVSDIGDDAADKKEEKDQQTEETEKEQPIAGQEEAQMPPPQNKPTIEPITEVGKNEDVVVLPEKAVTTNEVKGKQEPGDDSGQEDSKNNPGGEAVKVPTKTTEDGGDDINKDSANGEGGPADSLKDSMDDESFEELRSSKILTTGGNAGQEGSGGEGLTGGENEDNSSKEQNGNMAGNSDEGDISEANEDETPSMPGEDETAGIKNPINVLGSGDDGITDATNKGSTKQEEAAAKGDDIPNDSKEGNGSENGNTDNDLTDKTEGVNLMDGKHSEALKDTSRHITQSPADIGKGETAEGSQGGGARVAGVGDGTKDTRATLGKGGTKQPSGGSGTGTNGTETQPVGKGSGETGEKDEDVGEEEIQEEEEITEETIEAEPVSEEVLAEADEAIEETSIDSDSSTNIGTLISTIASSITGNK